MTNCKFNHVKIKGIAGVVPEKVINIDDEIEFYNNDEKLLNRNKKILGLGTRHVVDEFTSNNDLCKVAAQNLIDEIKINKKSIESLIVVSTSHDYVYPASACILQGELNLSKDCMCYDMSGLACSGYVHGLLQAHSLIESGAVKNCLLLAGDLGSTHSDVRNRLFNMLFGDGAVATYLEYSEEEVESYFMTGTDGEGWSNLVAPAGGRKLPIRKDIADIEVTDDNGNVWHLWDDMMQGMDVFKFTMEVGPASIEQLLKTSNNTINDIDFVAIHQANAQIVATVAQHARIPKDKYSSETFTKYGNCGAASVATVLCDKCVGMNKILLCTFGIGLSYGAALVDFSETYNGGLKIYKYTGNKMTRQEQVEYWINKFKGNE